MPTRPIRVTANLLFLLGALLAILVALASAWGDYEGLSYFATGAVYAPFPSLRCPIALSRSEKGEVAAVFENPGEKTIEPYYEVEVSGLIANRRLRGHVAVEPHASREVMWTVDSQDVDLRYFILIKFDVLGMAGYPPREATCGILMLPSGPLSGEFVVLLGSVGSMLLMLAGLILPVVGLEGGDARRFDRAASTATRRMLQVLGICSAAAMLAGFNGWWAAALMLCTVCVLLLAVSLRYAVD